MAQWIDKDDFNEIEVMNILLFFAKKFVYNPENIIAA